MIAVLQAILDELSAVLDDERLALTRLDAAAVEALTGRKSALADRLADALKLADDASPAEKTQMLRAVSRVRWAAEANRALLTDAGDLLASVRAMPSGAGVYDRRSCVGRAGPALQRYGT